MTPTQTKQCLALCTGLSNVGIMRANCAFDAPFEIWTLQRDGWLLVDEILGPVEARRLALVYEETYTDGRSEP